MKTIVFALQVFGIMALLPVCVVIEMNHGTKSATAFETKVPGAEKTGNASADFNNSVTDFPFAVLALKQVTVKSKKKPGGTCCSCKNCKCGSDCTCTDL